MAGHGLASALTKVMASGQLHCLLLLHRRAAQLIPQLRLRLAVAYYSYVADGDNMAL